MRISCLFLSLCLGSLIAIPARASDPLPRDSASVIARMKGDLSYLASDALEGRGIDTAGNLKAVDYIRKNFKQMGLKSGTPDGTYFQPFKVMTPTILEPEKCRLAFTGTGDQLWTLKLDADYQAFVYSKVGAFDAPVVFVGYGYTSDDDNIKYDDFKGIDVSGKVVLMMRGAPRLNAEGNNTSDRAAGPLSKKLTKAVSAGAVAAIIVNNPVDVTDATHDRLEHPAYLTRGTLISIPVFQITQAAADKLLAATSLKSLKEADAAIQKEKAPKSIALANITSNGALAAGKNNVTVNNVIGVLEGEGPHANETVVVGGHCDHVGYGNVGSLAGIHDQIHNGADDNGSGTITVIELARRFATNSKKPQRRMVFMAFNAEESGLIGSDYYAKNPTFPIADTVAMFNFDMVGRLREDNLILNGRDTAVEFEDLVQRFNKKFEFRLQSQPFFDGASDHASFKAKGVPVLFFFTGVHEDYHRPSDDVEKINFEGMQKITEFGESLIDAVVNAPNRPEVAERKTRTKKKMLGVIPQNTEKNEGLLIRTFAKDAIAEKAGLRVGDVIVEMSGRPIRNISDFQVARESLDFTKDIEITVKREGKQLKIVIPAEPESQDQAKKSDASPRTNVMKSTVAKNGGKTAYLGARPNYGSSETKGVEIESVTDYSPAATIGLQKGDIIIRFGDKQIEDVHAYTQALAAHKPGQKTKIAVRRSGAEREFEVTLGTREGIGASR